MVGGRSYTGPVPNDTMPNDTVPNDTVPNDLVNRARDAAYTVVGFGVLGFQRLQVRRRQLTKEIDKRIGESIGGKPGEGIGGRAGVGRIVRRVDAVVDPVLDRVERGLPGSARTMFHQARQAGRLVERVVLF
jgi:hypothetical protein